MAFCDSRNRTKWFVETKSDCKLLGFRMFNHCLQPEITVDDKRRFTKLAWERLYPQDPFDLPDDNTDVIYAFSAIPDAEKMSSIKYDVIHEALRQFSFYYQVSMPYYEDVQFLKESVKRYKMFLQLKESCCPDHSIVPCFDIELIWQAHRLHPIEYAKDCQKILDSPKIFPPSNEFRISFERTRKLWKSKFHVEYERSGTMYRGEHPSRTLARAKTENSLEMFSLKIFLESLRIPKFFWHKEKTAVVEISVVEYDNDERIGLKRILITEHWNIGQKTSDFHSNFPRQNVITSESEGMMKFIEIEIKTKSSIRKREKVIARNKHKSIPVVPGVKRSQTPLLVFCKHEKVFQNPGLFIDVEFSLLDSHLLTNVEDLTFTIEESAFEKVEINKDSLTKVVGPITFGKSIEKDSHCLQANHRSVNIFIKHFLLPHFTSFQ